MEMGKVRGRKKIPVKRQPESDCFLGNERVLFLSGIQAVRRKTSHQEVKEIDKVQVLLLFAHPLSDFGLYSNSKVLNVLKGIIQI